MTSRRLSYSELSEIDYSDLYSDSLYQRRYQKITRPRRRDAKDEDRLLAGMQTHVRQNIYRQYKYS